MCDPIVKLTDSSGQAVVIVVDRITHLVASGDAHTEVYVVGGTYVRVRLPINEAASCFWPTALQGNECMGVRTIPPNVAR